MWLMDYSWQRCFFLAEGVDPPLAKPSEMVLIVPCSGGSDGVMLVRTSCGSWLVGWVGHRSWRVLRGDIDDQIAMDVGVRLCGRSGRNGRHEPILLFYLGVPCIRLWYDHCFYGNDSTWSCLRWGGLMVYEMVG